MLAKLDFYLQKNDAKFLSFILYNINSKWIKNFHLNMEALKLLEENVGVVLKIYRMGLRANEVFQHSKGNGP